MNVTAMNFKKHNPFIEDYNRFTEEMKDYFHYQPFGDVKARYDHLMTQDFDRQALVSILKAMNEAWDAPQASMTQIERLNDPNSVAVVGGQQAGLLTGPMYSLNKVISIIKYAKEKEAALGQPVVPVFWIAGEDHDFDEINHTFTIHDENVKKQAINQYEPIKKSVSEMTIDQEACRTWLKHLVNDLPETKYTKAWLDETLAALTLSDSYVDFFARLIFQLFEDEGLVLFNAHDTRIRSYESDYFMQLFDKHEAIAKEVAQKKRSMENAGYACSLDAGEDDVHLFYHDDHGERILLKKVNHEFVGKKGEVTLSQEDMKELIISSPERLSNNVVTRPIMQELVFPTLAFIAGDGEIAYWATLKNAFEVMNLKMPLIVPRLSFTYVNHKLTQLANQRELTIESVIQSGTMLKKQHWLAAQQPRDLEPLFTLTKENIQALYQPLEQAVEPINKDLTRDVRKNLTYVFKQIDYLKKRSQAEVTRKYNQELKQFDKLESLLHPNQGLQERSFTPYLIINEHGKSFIHQLIEDDAISFKNNHYIITLN